MRNKVVLFSCLLLLVVITACDNSSTGSTSIYEDAVEVKVDGASYVISGRDSGDSIDEDGGLLKVDLQIKNITDSSINLFPDMDIQLYDEDNQIDPSKDTNPALDMSFDSNNGIGSNKQKVVTVLFNVEKDTEYELNVAPQSVDFEMEFNEVTIPLDTSEYNDSLASLQDPGKALEAYVETIFFDKDNSDYEKYVSADKNSLQDDAKNSFTKILEFGLSGDHSSSDVEKYYESFKQASAEKDEIEAVINGNANDKAIVVLNYSAISYEDIASELKEYRETYREKNDDFDLKKEDEYALSKFDSVLDKVEAKKGGRELEVKMKKSDGKWMIDDSDIDSTKSIMRVFAEGVVR